MQHRYDLLLSPTTAPARQPPPPLSPLYAATTMATMSSKRKRGDHDLPQMRAAPGMHAPSNTTNNNSNSDFGEQYLQLDDGMENAESSLSIAEIIAQHQSGGGGEPMDEQPQLQHQQHQQPQRQTRGGGGGPQPSASDTAAAAMAQYHTMTVPQTTESAFMRQVHDPATDGAPGNSSGAGDPASAQQRQDGNSFANFDPEAPQKEGEGSPGENGETSPGGGPGAPGGPKPAVGSDEWHKVRRDNHKEVERRRRETINEGINELAKIVPGCEKNKGSILARAVQFITQLKENETRNIEKWTLEKLLTEQAIAELSASCDRLKGDCGRAWGEAGRWKRAAGGEGAEKVGGLEEGDAEGEEE
ncbi:basic helix-loop-helix protein [Teratosphaeriaceae sp. CCFEE 6253]|nr:basic helix-loop-helix protein [Teratosphaeriaceae sp. CCFEE 6253]